MTQLLPGGSQAGQDRWIIEQVFPGLLGGYFVEAGAGDGFYLSNTWLLEKAFHWQGICVEPSDMWWRLRDTRSCKISSSLLAGAPGPVEFLQSSSSSEFGKDPHHHLSGITTHIDCWHPQGETSTRDAVTLEYVLDLYKAPSYIHFLSLDVEGAEYEILRTFPFERYTFGAICVEHNNVEPRRTQIRELLCGKGYLFAGHNEFDDLYRGPRPPEELNVSQVSAGSDPS